MRRYAEGTTVTVQTSQGEISGILAKHGVKRQAWTSEPEGDTVHFELGGFTYLIRVVRADAEELRQQWIADGKPPTTTKYLPSEAQVAAEWRLGELQLRLQGRTLEEHITTGDSSIPLLAARVG